MSIFNGYQPDEEYNGPRIEEGEHLLKVIQAVERVSHNSGNELLEFELHTQNGVRLFYHIVQGDFFNKKLTQFYDCFGIQRGNQHLDSWIGHTGRAFIAKGKVRDNGKQYFEIKYLIVNPLKGQKGTEAPKQQPPAVNAGTNQKHDGFKDDIPF